MLSSQISEDFNCSPNLGIAEFTTNSIRNKIMWDLLKRVVEESKIRPHLPRPDEPACYAS